MTQFLSPIPPDKRASILDILRGFSLLRLLIANSAVFSLYVFQLSGEKNHRTAPIDEVLNFLIHGLVKVDGFFGHHSLGNRNGR